MSRLSRDRQGAVCASPRISLLVLGYPVDELLQDAVAALSGDLGETLDRRHDDLVKPVDGEAFFEMLRQREEELSSQRTPS